VILQNCVTRAASKFIYLCIGQSEERAATRETQRKVSEETCWDVTRRCAIRVRSYSGASRARTFSLSPIESVKPRQKALWTSRLLKAEVVTPSKSTSEFTGRTRTFASTEEAKVSVTSTRKRFARECRVDLMLGSDVRGGRAADNAVVCRGFALLCRLEKSSSETE
jgi:hypothetical protein